MRAVLPCLRLLAPVPVLLLFLFPFLFFLPGCSERTGAGVTDGGVDATVRPGLFEDCTPGPADQEVPCAAGLRCALVQEGEAPYAGFLTQCVPVDPVPLAEEMPCAADQSAPPPAGAVKKRFDRCAAGLSCVTSPRGDRRCRALCPLRRKGVCGAGRLCVLPAPVESVGFCAAPDGCQPVAPQSGCPRDGAGPGAPLSCYVLADEERGGTFCLPQDRLGDSDGGLDSECQRSANCQAGLSCVSPDGTDRRRCRPYCALPAGTPDGGDGGTVPCEGGLGTCHPIDNYDRVGRCY